MYSIRTLTRALAGLCVFALLAQTSASAQQFKGQIKVGIHKTKLEAGKIYSVEMVSNCSDRDFPITECFPTRLNIVFATKIRDDLMYVIPTKTEEHTFFIISQLGPLDSAIIDYTLKVKPLAGDLAKPIVQKKITIADNDPIYQARNSRHKVETVKLKAGNTYVIDLVKTNDMQDPYLYLEDGNMKIQAQDDDSGGDLNARLVYQPQQDGDYRIIATTLNNSTGDMNLTVRMLPGKK
jgi:hypothetical protein